MVIRSVFAYLGPDQVVEGFYTFDGKTVTMMGDDGKGSRVPMMLDDEPVSERATPETAVAIAKVLTKRIRKALRGETVEGFGRRIDYSDQGIV
jgi:hypothetical protein